MYKADECSPRSLTPSHLADHGGSSAYRLSPYDEPHPYSLPGRRDIESARRQSLSDSPLSYTSYRERARRGSVAYGQLPRYDAPGPTPTTQRSESNLPPPYNNHESPPPYTSISHGQDEIDNMVPTRPRSVYDNRDGWRDRLSLLPRTR